MLTLPGLPLRSRDSEGGAAPGLGDPGRRNPGQERGQRWPGQWSPGCLLRRGESREREGGTLSAVPPGGQGAGRRPPPDFPSGRLATVWPSSHLPGTARVPKRPAPSCLRSWSSCLRPVRAWTACLGPADRWTFPCRRGSVQPLAAPCSPVPSTRCGEETLPLWGTVSVGPRPAHVDCSPKGRAPEAQGPGLDSQLGLENRG